MFNWIKKKACSWKKDMDNNDLRMLQEERDWIKELYSVGISPEEIAMCMNKSPSRIRYEIRQLEDKQLV